MCDIFEMSKCICDTFQKVLSAIEMDMYHDTIGCPDCQIHGDWEYCRHSYFHPQHNLRVCPESQACFCLNLKNSYDYFDYLEYCL